MQLSFAVPRLEWLARQPSGPDPCPLLRCDTYIQASRHVNDTVIDRLLARDARDLRRRRLVRAQVQRFFQGRDALAGLAQPAAELAGDVLVDEQVRLRVRL